MKREFVGLGLVGLSLSPTREFSGLRSRLEKSMTGRESGEWGLELVIAILMN